MHPDAGRRASYCDKHLLGEVPDQIGDFSEFFEERKQRLRERLGTLLERSGPTAGADAQVEQS